MAPGSCVGMESCPSNQAHIYAAPHRSPGAAQYVHLVISPENGTRMRDEDFHTIAREWTHDESGREYPHLGPSTATQGAKARERATSTCTSS